MTRNIKPKTKKEKKVITPDKWVWMPHPAHFIASDYCRFILATRVGKYIISTVGEYVPDETSREIHCQVGGITLEGKGDNRLADYMEKVGFQEIGCGRKYETMVFKARKMEKKNCPACLYGIDVSKEMDSEGYNDSGDAYRGHLRLCRKWSIQ